MIFRLLEYSSSRTEKGARTMRLLSVEQLCVPVNSVKKEAQKEEIL